MKGDSPQGRRKRILLGSFIVVIPFVVCMTWYGHDIYYHLDPVPTHVPLGVYCIDRDGVQARIDSLMEEVVDSEGSALIERLAEDLTPRFGRGFSRQNLQNMRQFYLAYPPDKIRQTVSGKSDAIAISVRLRELLAAFLLSWSAYVRLLSVGNVRARVTCPFARRGVAAGMSEYLLPP